MGYFLHHLNKEQLVLLLFLLGFVAFTLFCHIAPAAFPWILEKLTQRFALWSSSEDEATSVQIGRAVLSDRARMMHTHIVGATGSGKTVCMEHLLFSDLKRGLGALVIDPKGEREFYERVRSFVKTIGREKDLYLLSAAYPTESVLWNPCGVGGVSELQTKFFNSAIYNEPHYAKACEAALLRAFSELTTEYQGGFTISHLVFKLEDLARETKEKNIEGLFYDLYNLAHGEWGNILGCGNHRINEQSTSIFDIISQKKILFVDLPTEGKAVQNSRMGRLLTQEIVLISGMLKRHPEIKSNYPFSVFIDEFDAFGTESFISFLNKGRSSGFLITLAHQTLSDLKRISPTFEGQVIGNTDVRFIFRQNDPKDCETWAKIFGTKKVVKKTYQTQAGSNTGASSNREAQEFRIHPDAIKEQKTGRCIFNIKSENRLLKLKIPKPLKLKIEERKPESSGILVRGLGTPPPQKLGIVSEVKQPNMTTPTVTVNGVYSDLPEAKGV